MITREKWDQIQKLIRYAEAGEKEEQARLLERIACEDPDLRLEAERFSRFIGISMISSRFRHSSC